MRITICNDDSSIIERYRGVLEKLGRKHGINLFVSGSISGEHLLFQLPEDPNGVDLVYLDTDFQGKMDGITVALKLRAAGYINDIVFLSDDGKKVFDAFDVDPLNYLVEGNFNLKKFEEVFLKAWKRQEGREKEILSLSCAGEVRNIPLVEIQYFEVSRRIITVYYGEEKFEFYSTMGKLENLLTDRGFIRSHRAYIVGTRYISSISGNQVVLADGTEIPIGRTYIKKLNEKMDGRLDHETSRLYIR